MSKNLHKRTKKIPNFLTKCWLNNSINHFLMNLFRKYKINFHKKNDVQTVKINFGISNNLLVSPLQQQLSSFGLNLFPNNCR